MDKLYERGISTRKRGFAPHEIDFDLLDAIDTDVSDLDLDLDDEKDGEALNIVDSLPHETIVDHDSDFSDNDEIPLINLLSENQSSSSSRAVNRPPQWKHTNDFGKIINPIHSECGNLKKPYEYFQKYIEENFFSEMANFTNMRGVEQRGKSYGLTTTECRQFWGVSIIVALLGFPRLRMCWEAKTRYDLIADNMSRDRFYVIRSNMKIVDDNAEHHNKSDKFWKVRPLLNRIKTASMSNQRSTTVSIDEQMIPFQGHVEMRQYVKGKPNPVGLKNFVMCTSYGLPLDFEVYAGKGSLICSDKIETPENLDVGGRYVLKLSDSLPPDSIIYTDRFFSSIKLSDTLLNKRQIYTTGTLMQSRIPKEIRLKSDSNLKKEGRGSFDQVVRQDGVIALIKWFDNRGIQILSSHSGVEQITECRRWSKKDKRYIQIKMPRCFQEYNINMGGVDLLDRVVSKYSMRARTKKWTVRMIHHFFDFAIAASWIEYKYTAKQQGLSERYILDYYNFKLTIAENLIYPDIPKGTEEEEEANEDESEEYAEPILPAKRRKPKPLPHSSTRLTEHLPEWADQNTRSRCRLQGCCQLTYIKCSTCDVFLCLNAKRNCYKLFHTNKK